MPTTVSGNIKNLATGSVGSSQNAILRFILRGTGESQPVITGTGAIAPTSANGIWYTDIAADANGAVSGTIYSTRDATGLLAGDITVSGSGTAVYYDMVVIANGMSGPSQSVHAKNGATLDPSSVTPITTPPVVSAPTGDGTYLRIDGGNSPVTGLADFTAGITSKKVNGEVNAAKYSGSDIGAQINAAYADLPSAGGDIYVPAGSYSFSTAISLSTAHKYGRLISGPGGVVKLTYTGTGTAVTLNIGNADVFGTTEHRTSYGLEGIYLYGPGTSSGVTGISLGGTNGAEGALLRTLQVENFSIGLSFAANVFLPRCEDCTFIANGQNVVFPNVSGGGENIRFSNCLFANPITIANAVQIIGGGALDVYFENCSFDISQLSLTATSGLNSVFCSGCHFENSTFVYDFFSVANGANNFLSLDNCTFITDTTGALTRFGAVNGGSVSITNCYAAKNGAATAVGSWCVLANGSNGFSFGCSNPNGAVTGGVFGGTTTGRIIDFNKINSGVPPRLIADSTSDDLLQFLSNAGVVQSSISSQGDMVYSVTGTGPFWNMTSGNQGYIQSGGTTLNVRPGSGGIIVRNNADNATVISTSNTGVITEAGAILTAAAPTVAASQVGLGSTTATSATAGANGAVPAQVAGYLIINVAGTVQKIPYFNT